MRVPNRLNKLQEFNASKSEELNSKKSAQNPIKSVQVEDLLDRDPISIDFELIANDIKNKTVLVTGGAGSIGSEIIRQLAEFSPKLVIILDQAETALYELEQDLQRNYPDLPYITELADISKKYRMELLFGKYELDMIYHAAAYKHVPLIERNPHEAIYVNISGTVNLAKLAVEYDIEKFVMISTDKAVNPTSVMGASKRVAEMYVQSLQNEKGVRTKFITTRFGNVLGSSGSVVPLFGKQIEQGGPVTVTHKDIIRYFMTISEACQLVLQAGTMGKGGEVYHFDMGVPIKIYDLAKKMIKLSGLEPFKDIDIIITGLRAGEKLYEELVSNSSTSLPTHHPKIMSSRVPAENFNLVKSKVDQIIRSSKRAKNIELVQMLKDLVPEYKSENSEYEILDNQEPISREEISVGREVN